MTDNLTELTDALYADNELGPGYMYRDDCEHLALRFLSSDWLAKYIAEKQDSAWHEGWTRGAKDMADTVHWGESSCRHPRSPYEV